MSPFRSPDPGRLGILLGAITILLSVVVGYSTYRISRHATLERLGESQLALARVLGSAAGLAETATEAEKVARVEELWARVGSPAPGRYLCIVGADGRLRANTGRPENVGADVSGVPLPGPPGPGSVGGLVESRVDWVGENRNLSGERQIVAYAWAPGIPGLVAVHVPSAVVASEVAAVTRPWAIGFGLATLVLFPLSLLLVFRALRTSQASVRSARGERAHLEAQLRHVQKMESLGTMAGGIAHDFNNILSAILGNAQLARGPGGSDPETAERLDRIVEAGTRARDLVDRILAFSRRVDHERGVVSANDVVEEAIRLVRPSTPPPVRIETAITPRALAVTGDATQLHQVVVNLCTNAAQAMPRGGRLSVSLVEETTSAPLACTATTLDPGRWVRLDVEDEGEGMDPPVRERIFDPFFTTKGEGTGLGLAVVQGIVREHGGGIRVESERGRGTRFSVYLPATDAEPGASVPPVPGLPTGDERVLLVDDDDAVARVGSDTLELLGYRVTTCRDGREALERLRATADAWDILVTDHTMPFLGGDELAIGVRSIRPDLPMVLCTGFSDHLSDGEIAALGFAAHLRKPILAEDLARTIRAALDGVRTPARS